MEIDLHGVHPRCIHNIIQIHNKFYGIDSIMWNIFHIQYGWWNIPHNIVSPM